MNDQIDLVLLLRGHTTEKLAFWWCQFNSFLWPDDFPLPKSAGWDEMSSARRYRCLEAKLAWAALCTLVPKKEQARAWHRYGLSRPVGTDSADHDEDFESW